MQPWSPTDGNLCLPLLFWSPYSWVSGLGWGIWVAELKSPSTASGIVGASGLWCLTSVAGGPQIPPTFKGELTQNNEEHEQMLPTKAGLVLFSSSVMSHGLFATPWTAAHWASLSFPSPGACSYSCPLSQWCHPTISSSIVPFSWVSTFNYLEVGFPFSSWRWMWVRNVVVSQSCLTLCETMDCSMPGFPILHLEFAQTHVQRVSDAIQPSHPLSLPSPFAFNLFQHQGLFQWVSSLHQVAKVLELQLQHQSFQWIFRIDFL